MCTIAAFLIFLVLGIQEMECILEI